MLTLLHRLIAEENAQDLIEYALLCSFIGLAGAAGFQLVMNAIGNTYGIWDTQVNDLWNTPDPGAGS
jgi:Flp pilus assembly pilin Flp